MLLYIFDIESGLCVSFPSPNNKNSLKSNIPVFPITIAAILNSNHL